MNAKKISQILARMIPGIAWSAASASQFKASIEIPRLNVAEYHRPYVAVWIETPDRAVAANLAVWYDVDMRDDEGETWLKDLRQWWRKSGRSQDLPIDGVSGPTQPVGIHEITVDTEDGTFPELAAGAYFLVVEAAREVGGRELLRLPFSWSEESRFDLSVTGERELGTITFKTNND